MKSKNPILRAFQDGSYALEKVERFRGSQGEVVETGPYTHLCRCGRSADKPFCDNNHELYGFKTRKLQGRQPDRVDRYEGKTITIRDNRGVCSYHGHRLRRDRTGRQNQIKGETYDA